MKSEKAKEYITHATCTAQEYAERFGGRELVVSRWDVSTAIELAEQDAEMRMQTKAHKIILDMMTGIFHGNMPQKIADEFIQKLTDDENN
ncbi:hypothetical protein [Alistipes shahii]|jgi:hypothetical protein|uniref:hypothetical protein n=1 Tax=Alistipes shahii TaxID=328814 RepID=UPI00266F6545|nr:hypothetical protein [Alistipes shahii]